MFATIKNGIVRIKEDTMYYIRFGKGKKTLVMLPGLGDGLTTVKGTALPMSVMYRIFSKDYTVYMFSRRNHLPKDSNTRMMAHDLKDALNVLGIEKIDLVGVSMGGMIAQYFAVDYSEMVGKLVLVATCAQSNSVLAESVQEWMALAKGGNHIAFMDSNVRKIYSEDYYQKNKWLIPIMGKLTKPVSYERFFIQAEACLNHDSVDQLSFITMPTLVIGGEQDRVLGGVASKEIADALPNALLKIYPQWGHGLYEEAKDFNQVVLDFLKQA